MAVTGVTAVNVGAGARPSMPVYQDLIELDLDNSYVTGGYDCEDLILAVIGKGRTILGVSQQSFPTAHLLVWNATTKKLQAFTEALAEAANGANLSSAANVRLLVTSY
jgi:hypothetical protein